MLITTAEAIVRYLIAKRAVVETTPGATAVEAPLVPLFLAIASAASAASEATDESLLPMLHRMESAHDGCRLCPRRPPDSPGPKPL